MAIQKMANGKWRAFVGSGPDRKSKVFDRKALAQDWEAEQKTARKSPPVEVPHTEQRTLRDLLEKYRDEETPKKKGRKHETNRLNRFLKEFDDVAGVCIDKLEPKHLETWRDARLLKAKPGSVRREYSTLRAALHHAADVWRWPLTQDPTRGFKAPHDSPEREEVWGWRDILALFREVGYRPGSELRTSELEAVYAFHITLRTALRSGEILQLGSASINWDRRIAVIRNHKTEHRTHRAKRVPLFRRALRLLAPYKDRAQIFTISDAVRDASFRTVRDRATRSISHLTFHDGRATCLSLLSRRMPVEVLQKVSDHEDLKTLVNRYYRVTPEQIAERYAG